MSITRNVRATLSAACLAVLLTACGGGVSQVDAFVPDRIYAFGDEHSVLTSAGRKYSVNALTTAGAVDCEASPLWIQSVANAYGFKFEQCLGTATEAKAITRAVNLATVAGMKAQIDAQEAAGFATKSLALLLVGMHDVREVYEARLPADTEATLIARAGERGEAYAAQVNRLIGLGVKVIVATAPDLGLTPWGLAKGTTEAALLTRLSNAFNGRMRVKILNDGRYVGLVLADEILLTAVQVPSAYGLGNVKDAVCRSTAVLPDCDNNATSLVDGATSAAWLWADSLHFGSTAHVQIGGTAAQRAQTNPF